MMNPALLAFLLLAITVDSLSLLPSSTTHQDVSSSSLAAVKLRHQPTTADHQEEESGFHHNFDVRFLRQEQLAGRDVNLNADPCGTKTPSVDEMEQMNKAVASWRSLSSNNRRRLEETSYVIPVHLHILKETQEAGDLSTTSQRKFISTLNHGFRDSPFTFSLASVTETVHNEWYECSDEEGFKEALRVNGTDVLNIYVCDTHAQSAGQIGYSYYPPITQESWRSLDGVVIMNPDMGVFEESAVYNGLVHEVGHFLGLAHTFEGGCSTDVVNHWGNRANYQFSGDGVADTPAHDGATFGQNVGRNTCWQDTELDTCDDGINGCDPGMDPIDNYMNVIPGPCYDKFGRFTSGQMERMLAQYETFRFRGVLYEPSVTSQTCSKRRQDCDTNNDCCGALRCYKRGKCGR